MLDLNIWVADLLATRNGRADTAAQVLVDMVRHGTSPLGLVQLVISWGMLDRLATVLERVLHVTPGDARQYINLIAHYAARGPDGCAPYLLLGGTGLIPLRDSEDGHVLEAAEAGEADLLVTRNLDDFVVAKAQVLVPRELVVIPRPTGHAVIVADPAWVMQWLRAGAIAPPL